MFFISFQPDHPGTLRRRLTPPAFVFDNSIDSEDSCIPSDSSSSSSSNTAELRYQNDNNNDNNNPFRPNDNPFEGNNAPELPNHNDNDNDTPYEPYNLVNCFANMHLRERRVKHI